MFGRDDGPRPSLADAVAASCAIPGFYRPVRIGGQLYVDGGVASMSNLDLLAGRGLDLVICMNPTSSLHAPAPRTLGDRAAGVLRQASGRRLGSEAKRVRGSGTDVVLMQPTIQDLDAMGTNLMSAKRRHEVLEVGARTVAKHLREPAIADSLSGLRPGDPRLVAPAHSLAPTSAPTAAASARSLTRPDFASLAVERWQRPISPRTRARIRS